jgi:hypothetical protein
MMRYSGIAALLAPVRALPTMRVRCPRRGVFKATDDPAPSMETTPDRDPPSLREQAQGNP